MSILEFSFYSSVILMPKIWDTKWEWFTENFRSECKMLARLKSNIFEKHVGVIIHKPLFNVFLQATIDICVHFTYWTTINVCNWLREALEPVNNNIVYIQ